MTDRIPAHAVVGLTTASLTDFDTTTPPADGQAPLWDAATQKYVPGTPTAAPASVLVPLTTTIGGVPELVWDANNNLVMTEVPQ